MLPPPDSLPRQFLRYCVEKRPIAGLIIAEKPKANLKNAAEVFTFQVKYQRFLEIIQAYLEQLSYFSPGSKI